MSAESSWDMGGLVPTPEELGIRLCENKWWPKEIKATSGTEKFSSAYDVFGDVDTLFSMLGGNESSAPTERMEIGCYVTIREHTFAQVFGSIASDLDKACVTLNQIKEFARANMQWIVDSNRSFYFLFKYGGKYHIASVTTDPLSPRHLKTLLFRYDDTFVWPYRLVQTYIVPKQ